MADLMSAAAREALPAMTPRVDHRAPIHDQSCRCTGCKPARHPRAVEARRRSRAAFAILLGVAGAVAVMGLGPLV